MNNLDNPSKMNQFKQVTGDEMNTHQPAQSIKKTLVASVIIGALTIAPLNVYASETLTKDHNQKEVVSFGVGAVIGAILGGPAGAFITGLAGSLMAKTENQRQYEKQLVAALESNQHDYEQQYAKFSQQINQLSLALTDQKSQAKRIGQLQLDNLLMSMQFSTGSAEIAQPYHEQLAALADILKQSPAVTVDLSGYTDKQGDEHANELLSLARANAVKSALINEGVEGARISTNGYGEEASVVAKQDNEPSFFDRRVVIKLHIENALTAQN